MTRRQMSVVATVLLASMLLASGMPGASSWAKPKGAASGGKAKGKTGGKTGVSPTSTVGGSSNGVSASIGAWPQSQYDARNTGWNSAETLLGPSNVGDLQANWTFQLDGELALPPVIAEGRAYFASYFNSSDLFAPDGLYAVDVSSGQLIWRRQMEFDGLHLNGIPVPAVDNGLLFIGDSHRMYALDAATGEIRWTFTPAIPGLGGDSPPTLAGGRVYIHDHGFLYALDAATGALLWRVDGATAPAVHEGVVYAAGHGSDPEPRLFARRASDGSVIWSANLGEQATALDEVVVAHGRVYAVGSDSVFAVDAASGAILWQHGVGGLANTHSLTADAERVYHSGSAIEAIDAETGTHEWWPSGIDCLWCITRAPAIANGLVYGAIFNFGSPPEVFGLRASDGQLVWRSPLISETSFPVGPAVADGSLYLNHGSRLYAFSVPSDLPPPDLSYAALGDSYSSGEGAPPFDPESGECHRSENAYPHRFDLLDPSGLTFVACSGAELNDVLRRPQHGQPPQISALSGETDLVSLTIGGNDAGFLSVLLSCTVHPACHRAPQFSKTISRNIQRVGRGLRTLYSSLVAAAPNARIFVLGYPHIFPPAGTSTSGCNLVTRNLISRNEMDWLRQNTVELYGVIASAVSATAAATGGNINFVPGVLTAFNGHQVCSDDPWVNGMVPAQPEWSFHPNVDGHARLAEIFRAAVAA